MKMMNTRTFAIVVAVLFVSSCLTAFCLRNLGVGSSTSTTGISSYAVVDTGQNKCYDNMFEISNPQPGQAFYGQDAQYEGAQPSYQDNGDGTVTDLVTGLMWQKSPDRNGDGVINYSDKLYYDEAVALAASFNLSGYTDWRLPTINELYSLIVFSGAEPSPSATSPVGCVPFINTTYFDFGYGDLSAGERLIDAQYATSTTYVSTTMRGDRTMFGVNFADGRIKGYPADRTIGKKYYVLYVRGNANYGISQFVDNGDGTIMDNATGLMWTKSDSGTGMNWQEALAWVQTKNAANYLGHSDWRLPNAKELQSIVDYTRSPSTNGSAAIDPVFTCTSITNEAGQADYPYYWTGTTHTRSGGSGGEGVYVAFGRAMGYMNGSWIDVHGAGAQRSDPKSGNPADYPYGRGPQGDAIRIYNYIRCVRGGLASPDTTSPEIIILSPQNITYATTSVPLTFTINDYSPISWIGYSLDSEANVTITGNTTLSGLTFGSHNVIVYSNDTYGNMGSSDKVYFTITEPSPPVVNVAITDIAFSEQNPTVSETIHIYVTIENRGNFTETFDVSANYTLLVDPLIGIQTITLAPGEPVTLNFTWIPTTSGRYEIRAHTSTIPDDIDLSDNTRIVYLYVSAVYTSTFPTEEDSLMDMGISRGKFYYEAISPI